MRFTIRLRRCHTRAVTAAPDVDDDVSGPSPAAAPSPRELRRARELETRRREVLDAAEALFSAAGFEGASLDRIAASSGHSVGSIYNLFPSKDAVYTAVLERPARLLVEHLAECTEGTGMARLLAMATVAVTDMRAFPPHARASLAGPAAHRTSSHGREITGAMLDLYAGAIRQGQADGSVRAGDPTDLARYVGGLISAHIHVDPEIAGRQGRTSLAAFLDVVRGAMSPPPRA
jgi:AcrR family transcriptional regulator